jgi:DNA invertase Pin-like site-specific DNA recombinase
VRLLALTSFVQSFTGNIATAEKHVTQRRLSVSTATIIRARAVEKFGQSSVTLLQRAFVRCKVAIEGELRMTKLVAYFRVSTRKQGDSGLGLEAQQAAVGTHAKATGAKVVASFQEIESGKRCDRPELARAITACRRHGATLCIAKLDRLARNVHFVSGLMESKVPFVCCDNPTATPLTIHILAAVAEDEAKRISERTRAALAAAKARGVALGCPANLKRAARRKGTAANVEAARQHASTALPVAQKLREAGQSLADTAERLTDSGILTRRGKAWTPTAVLRLLG